MSTDTPVFCSLRRADLERRLAAIGAVGAASLISREVRGGRHLLRFRADGATRRRLEAIVAAEAECCAFLDLLLSHSDGEMALSIAASGEGQALADGLAAAFEAEPLRVLRWCLNMFALPMSDQQLGEPIDWTPVQPPRGEPLRGDHVLLRPFDPAADAEPLHAISHLPAGDPTIWTFLPDGPYESPAHLQQMLSWARGAEGHVYYAIEPLTTGRPLGQASYLRIEPAFGTIEIGHIWFGLELRRTTAASEAIYLLARHAFDELGYRRLEWKCDALNAASRRAAERFGFRPEGVFRNHQIVKGRNRDTAWFAITDGDWPAIRAGFEAWLSPDNFDAQGAQKRSLTELTAA